MAWVVVFALGVAGDSGLKYFGCRRLDDIVKLAGGTIDYRKSRHRSCRRDLPLNLIAT